MSENLYNKRLPITVPQDGNTINIVEEKIEPLYPKETRHDNTRLFFDTLLWCYCTAIVIQIFTFLPVPHYYVVRAVNVLIGLGIFCYGLVWAVSRRNPNRKTMFLGLGIIMGAAIGL